MRKQTDSFLNNPIKNWELPATKQGDLIVREISTTMNLKRQRFTNFHLSNSRKKKFPCMDIKRFKKAKKDKQSPHMETLCVNVPKMGLKIK